MKRKRERGKGCERKRETALRERAVEIPPFDITPFDRHLANLHETCGASTPFCLRFKTRRGGSSRKPFSIFLSPLATRVPAPGIFFTFAVNVRIREFFVKRGSGHEFGESVGVETTMLHSCLCLRGSATWMMPGDSLVSTAECLCLRLVVDVACRASLLRTPGFECYERRAEKQRFRGTGLFLFHARR